MKTTNILIIGFVSLAVTGCSSFLPMQPISPQVQYKPTHTQLMINSIQRICNNGNVKITSTVREIDEMGATSDSEFNIDCGTTN